MTLQELVDYMKPDFLDRCDRCPPDNDMKDGCKYIRDRAIPNCLICKKDFVENRYKNYNPNSSTTCSSIVEVPHSTPSWGV